MTPFSARLDGSGDLVISGVRIVEDSGNRAGPFLAVALCREGLFVSDWVVKPRNLLKHEDTGESTEKFRK